MKNACIVAFLGVQLLLPLHGFVHDKFEREGRFSWNMYSKMYGCRSLYVLRTEDGKRRKIPHASFFNIPNRNTLVFHRDDLPDFHRFLCERHESITASVSCTLNNSPELQLVEPGVDICTADNFGVKQD